MSISGPGGGPDPVVFNGYDDPAIVERFNHAWDFLATDSVPVVDAEASLGAACTCGAHLPQRERGPNGGVIEAATLQEGPNEGP